MFSFGKEGHIMIKLVEIYDVTKLLGRMMEADMSADNKRKEVQLYEAD